ncbi:TRAP transporter substrate-binding protein DctP [Roseomonas gilardii subsp. gilardii]|uniref:TRAP transporter substrate-binding protein n=1 Tax=Roseomonas gilardii TaxID=257708 RepID=UPI001FF7C580|nr:TRAP transporter substrate-binding protein DctP [Roseomonas gilardii]UPG73330.1 TRAP transporter substrate-binding protein DctP [Roseomonas gilardii subsp. gilardii]
MQRRALLTAAMAAAPALPAAAQAPAPTGGTEAMPEVRWRLTSSFPRSTDILYGTAEKMTKRVSQLTDNKFQIRLFAAGEIVGGLQALDAVQNNTVEACHTATYYYTGKDPAFAFFTVVPFGMNDRQQTSWYQQGGGQALLEELLKDYNAVPFMLGNTGAQMGGWFRKEIKGLDDVKGLKFRIAGLAGDMFAKMGAVPTQLAASDIYPALERGTIDAVEFVGPHDDEKLGFARVAPYYYYPGFFEPCAQTHLLVNQRALAALPPHYRAALEAACAEANTDMLSRYDQSNPEALRRLVGAGTQLRPWPRDVMTAAWKAANELYEEIGNRNERFKRIWDSYRKYRDEEFLWFRVAEQSYANFAFTAAQTVK